MTPSAPRPRRRDRPSRRVTEEQQRALRAIACLTLLHGRPPALGELAAVFGVTKVAICLRLRWLEKKGLCARATRSFTEPGLAAIGLGLPGP